MRPSILDRSVMPHMADREGWEALETADEDAAGAGLAPKAPPAPRAPTVDLVALIEAERNKLLSRVEKLDAALLAIRGLD